MHWILGYFTILVHYSAGANNMKSGIGIIPKDQFGVMRPHMVAMELCKGPKLRNCTDITLSYSGGDATNVSYIFILKKNTQIIKSKVSLWFSKTSNVEWSTRSPDILKWVDQPCKHFFFGPLFNKFFNATASCIIQKGTYNIQANITRFVYDLFGDQFFYGRYRSHAVVLGRDCNFSCVINDVSFDDPGKNVTSV